jgi:hypothetical protein
VSKCIIHMGMHKTGSTSIQQSLHGYSDDRVLYAALGDAGNHSLAMFSLFSSDPERHHLHKASGRTPAAVRAYIAGVHADLHRSIVAANGRTLVISGEDIGVLQADGLERMRELFQKRFDQVTIVGYVRPPGTFMASSFQQRVRRGVRLSLEKSYRNYQKSFAKFDDVFGRENVDLWKFDPKSFPNGCAVRDFCSRLGIALPAERILRLNESLSRQAVLALYAYHHLSRKEAATMKSWEAQQIGALLSGPGSTRFRFSPEAIKPVLEANRADIEWMEARLGQSLTEELRHEPGDVASEDDLLSPDPRLAGQIGALLEKAGVSAPGATADSPQTIAALVHALRGTLKPQNTGKKGGAADKRAAGKGQDRPEAMRVTEIIQEIREANPALLESVPQPRAEALVRDVFRHISSNLAKADDGIVQYAGLGQFMVRKKDSGARIRFLGAGTGNDVTPDSMER